MSEQLKSEGYQELSKDEIFEKLTAFNEEVAEEISTKGDRGKHGSKTTELLREEIYSLERALDEALEAHDQLRTYYIQELNATKEELKADDDLGNLKRTVNSIRAQIGARKRILKLRGETVTATDSEVLKIERKAMKKIENFEQDLASAQNEIQEAKQEIESLQEDVDRFKAANDLDSYRAALADQRTAQSLLEEAEKSAKNLKRKINYHKNKLKRLANEKSKQPAGDAEQVAPGTAEKAQEQVDEREDTDSGAVPKKAQANVKPISYTKNGKTGLYTVRIENDKFVVYNSKNTPVNFAPEQLTDKNKIIGKYLVREGLAEVVAADEGTQQYIVVRKSVMKGETYIINANTGQKVNKADISQTPGGAEFFDALIKQANDKFKARQTNKTEIPTDKSTEKNVIEEKGRQNLKKEIDNKQTQPGAPKSDKLTVVAEYEMSDLLEDPDPITAAFGPAGDITDLAPPSAKDNLGIKDGAEFKRFHTMQVSTPQGEQQAVDFMIKDANKAGMDWKIGTSKATVNGRDVIEIVMPNGYSFLMYKSSGTGSTSKSKNLWVPIPGFANDKIGRFIKVYDSNGKDPKFSKYNVPLFQNIANTLESLANEKVDPMSLERGWSPKSTPAAKKESVKPNQVINIYAGTNENKELSNFAIRPFTIEPGMSLDIPAGTYITVEGAFQAAKMMNATAGLYYKKGFGLTLTEKGKKLLDKLQNASGAEAKKLGKSIQGLKVTEWDSNSSTIMEDLIKKSFEQNPDALQKLLETGNATFTHTQDKSKWGKLFPQILMDVRDELRQANVKPAAPTMSGSGTQLTAVAAREDKVEVVDELNYKGDVQIKSRVVVSDTGAPDTFDADTLDGEPILLNKEKLVDPNLMSKDVTFEIIENDYYKNNPSVAVPIYYKIDGELVGKLEANSPNRDVLEQRLKDGEQVTMQVSEIIAGNFNHSRTMDGSSFFSDPREQFRDPLLAFVEVVEDIPAWTLSQVSTDKNEEGDVPQIKSDIVGTGTEKINYGQVGIIVRPENSPGGQARISMASTANLSPKAQSVAYQDLINENFEKAKTIVANSLFESQLGASQSEYMQFGSFKGGANFVVFQSPELGELVRITEENLKSAGQNKPFKYNIVEVTSDENGKQFFKNTNRNVANYNPATDLKDFLKIKKYHVSRDLGNVSTEYTSPVTGNKYNTYQDYLFSAEEIGTDRKVGKGHHSILTTDVVMLNGSMFHNPKITFSEDASNIKSAKDVIQSDSTAPGSAEQTQQQKSDLLNELSDMGGLNFGDQIKKDELDQDCPF